MGVASRSTMTVVPKGAAPDSPTCVCEMSAKGEGYRAANGGWVADRGAKELARAVVGSDGAAQVRGIEARVAGVSKAPRQSRRWFSRGIG